MRTTTFPTTRILFGLLVLFLTFASLPPRALADVQTTAAPQIRVTAPVDNAKRTTLNGHVPDVFRDATKMGHVDPSTPAKHLLIMLKSSPEQEREIRRIINEQKDKHTASYHQWMTPEEFGAHFGVHDADIEKVKAWLTSQGLTVEKVTKDKRAVEFSGTTGRIEQAFQTEMHYFLMPTGETYVSNDSDITVPAALSPVIASVPMLNNFFRPSTFRPLSSNGEAASDGTRIRTNAPTPGGPSCGGLAGDWGGTATFIDKEGQETIQVSASVTQTASDITATVVFTEPGGIPEIHTETGRLNCPNFTLPVTSDGDVVFVDGDFSSNGLFITGSGEDSSEQAHGSGTSIVGSGGTRLSGIALATDTSPEVIFVTWSVDEQ